MLAPAYDGFRIRRGNTADLGACIKVRNVLTQRRSRVPLAGSVVKWLVDGALKTTEVDLDESLIWWHLSAIETAALSAGTHPYEIIVTMPEGETHTVLTGRITVEG